MDKCRSTEIHEVKYRSLEVVPTGSDTFQAPSVGRCIALRGSALDDLREFVATANAANASGQDDPLGDLRDLGGPRGRGGGSSSSSGSRGVAGRGSGRGQISSAGSSKDKGDLASGPQRADVAEEEATLEEYAHEEPLKETLMKELRSLKETLAREGEDTAVDNAGQDITDPPPPLPPAAAQGGFQWESMDSLMDRAPGRWMRVRRPGSTQDDFIGEIQVVGSVRYQAVAHCCIPGHSECSRMRALRIAKEPTAQLERVLARWLVDGIGLSSQQHGALRRH